VSGSCEHGNELSGSIKRGEFLDWSVRGCTTALRPFLGSTQPSVLWVPGALSSRPGRKAEQSLPFSAKVKNAWSYISIPQYVCLARYLMHRVKFTFYITVFFMQQTME
jgi:hypothetical protein